MWRTWFVRVFRTCPAEQGTLHGGDTTVNSAVTEWFGASVNNNRIQVAGYE